MINLMYPWSIQFPNGKLEITNSFGTITKHGHKYSKVIHDNVPGSYEIKQVFYTRYAGKDYYLVLSKDKLPPGTPVLSKLSIPNVQIVFVQYHLSVICTIETMLCDKNFRIKRIWAFWGSEMTLPDKDLPADAADAADMANESVEGDPTSGDNLGNKDDYNNPPY